MPYFNKVFVPAPNTLQVEMVYTTYGGHAENVYHVQGDAAITDIAGLASNMITEFEAWETTSMKGLRSSAYALVKTVVRDVGQIDGPVFEHSPVIAGTQAADPVPDNSTIAVKWVTGRGGRSYRGRSYHIGLTTNMVSGDQLAAAFQASLPAAYQALRDRISNFNWNTFGPTHGRLVVVSASHNKVARAVAEITPITDAVLADTNLDSQRRRLRGRGS